MSNKKTKLIPLSKVSSRKDELDTVVSAKRARDDRRAYDVLFQAERYWAAMSRFRKERIRNKRYTYGEQWKDGLVVDGKYMTEEEYITKQGNVALKNNLIRRFMRNILGVYRGQSKEPTCIARDRDEQKLGETMSTILQYNMQNNKMSEVLARTMEEFIISGLAVHHKWYGWRNDRQDCWTDYVQPNNFFMDNEMRDFRGWDVSFIGEIHDESFGKICQEFATSPQKYRKLREIYSQASNRSIIGDFCGEFGYSRVDYDFFLTSNPNRCRVIEVWKLESKPRFRCHDWNTGEYYKIETEDYEEMVTAENAERISQGAALGMSKDDIPLIDAVWFMDSYWYFYYLSPFGDILKEGETPYAHKSHPYVFKAYPFIDGEIHSFVSDIIDQQRYINRLITLYDWVIRASAKGVLLFPEECLPSDMKLEDVAEAWTRVDGIIAIKTKGNSVLPQQIASNATNIGIGELLNIQLKLFDDIGVNGALQGKPGYSGMSARLYAQQAQNASTSLLDLLESFSSFVCDGAEKDVKNMQQYYDENRIISIAGRKGAKINPSNIINTLFDLSISESTNTPVYREMQNDLLMDIWKTGQISLEQMLEHGNFPFADELLQSIRAQKEQLQQGQLPEGVAPQLQQQVQQGVDMDAVNKGYNMLRA